MDVVAFQRRIARFAEDRDWDQFHSPKNLAVSICIEAAELLEHFQWDPRVDTREMSRSPDEQMALEEEIADVAIYLLRLSDKLGIDLESAVDRKLQLNAEKYPIELARGNALKYNRR